MTQLFALIWDTFRECRDKKLFWIMLLISTVVAGAIACISFTASGIEFFFGAISVDYPPAMQGSVDPQALTAAFISYVVISLYIGWAGTVIGLIATAGIFPAFTRSGAIDVVVSKPMSRWTIFLGKYMGALSFILVQSAYFVLVSLVVLRLHTGVWLWGYLWAIPLLTAMFSYLYCVSALAGLWTQSGVGALLVTMIFWMVIWGFSEADALFTMQRHGSLGSGAGTRQVASDAKPSGAATFVHRVSSVLPRTHDVSLLVADKMHALSIQEFAETFASMDEDASPPPDIPAEVTKVPSMARSVGTSLAFEAVVVLIAGFLFSRRDY